VCPGQADEAPNHYDYYLLHEDLLKALGLDRLELRCLHIDLIMYYKIVYGLVIIPFQSFLSRVYSKTLMVIR